MKVLLKGLTGIVLGCICLVCASSDIYAGTAIYVGKDASAEGTTLIGASIETGVGQSIVPVIVEKGMYKKGDVIECSNGYKYTLPEDSAKVTLERMMTYVGIGEWTSCASNEYGVSVVACITARSKEEAVAADPFEACGIGEEKLALILASTAKNAKEAVDILCGQIEEIGAETAEIVLIADQEEAWIVENYTGHQYAAVKLPADKMATFGHNPVIRTIDPESADTICSEQLLTLPEDKGFAVYDNDKNLDIIKTYNADGAYTQESHLREWIGYTMFGAEEENEFDINADYDAFFTPVSKIGITDAFDFFRYRNDEEQTAALDPETGTLGGVDNQYVAGVTLIQIYSDVPAQMSSVIWTTPSQAFASPFMPIPVIADSLPDALATDVTEDAYADGVLQFDFANLSSKLVARRNLYGSSASLLWEGEETLCAAELGNLIKGEWNEKYASSPEAVINEADKYVADDVEEISAIRDDISRQFDWYLIRNGVYNADTADEDLIPFEIDSPLVTLGNAAANGWDVNTEGDIIKAEKDGKTIEFTMGGEVKLNGFDTDSLIDGLFAEGNDDFVIELDDVESDDGLELALDENGELVIDEGAIDNASSVPEDAQEEAAEEPVEEAAEESAEEPAKEASEEPAKEAAEEPAQESAPEAKAEEVPAALPAQDPSQVDSIAELQGYFNEKIAAVPRDGWAENEIANELAGISTDVTNILMKYLNKYYEEYIGQLNGDIDDVEKIMNFDPQKAASDIATDVATDEELAEAGGDLAQVGVIVSGLVTNYFNSLAEDVTGDVVSGRLSQDGAVRILNEAAAGIEGVVGAYAEAAAGTVAQVSEDVKQSIPPKEEVKETLTEIDDALDVLDEYGVIDKDAIGLGDAKLADLADLTDADINVVVTLDAMDDATINGLSQLLGIDVRAALDKYIEQINAAGLGVTVNR